MAKTDYVAGISDSDGKVIIISPIWLYSLQYTDQLLFTLTKNILFLNSYYEVEFKRTLRSLCRIVEVKVSISLLK